MTNELERQKLLLELKHLHLRMLRILASTKQAATLIKRHDNE